MEILIIDGAYKGCEALTWHKGAELYFKDDMDNSDILLKNHPYILKDGELSDIVYLLGVAYGSGSLESFIKNIDNSKIKNPHVLRTGRIEKFYNKNKEIEEKLIELVTNIKENEQAVYNSLLTFVQDL